MAAVSRHEAIRAPLAASSGAGPALENVRIQIAGRCTPRPGSRVPRYGIQIRGGRQAPAGHRRAAGPDSIGPGACCGLLAEHGGGGLVRRSFFKSRPDRIDAVGFPTAGYADRSRIAEACRLNAGSHRSCMVTPKRSSILRGSMREPGALSQGTLRGMTAPEDHLHLPQRPTLLCRYSASASAAIHRAPVEQARHRPPHCNGVPNSSERLRSKPQFRRVRRLCRTNPILERMAIANDPSRRFPIPAAASMAKLVKDLSLSIPYCSIKAMDGPGCH